MIGENPSCEAVIRSHAAANTQGAALFWGNVSIANSNDMGSVPQKITAATALWKR